MPNSKVKPEIQEIKDRRAKITEPPWGVRLGSGQNVCTAIASENPTTFDEFVADCLPDYALKETGHFEGNRDFILAAPADVDLLLRELEQSEQERSQIKRIFMADEISCHDLSACIEQFAQHARRDMELLALLHEETGRAWKATGAKRPEGKTPPHLLEAAIISLRTELSAAKAEIERLEQQ